VHGGCSDVFDDQPPTRKEDAMKTAEAPKKSGISDRRSRRGFASMDPMLVRTLASKGGKAAHEQGTAHEFTSEEARSAGRKGGLAPHRSRGPGA
jgi:general stress protein YciG